MEPGGGLILLPFVRMVIGCLLALTTTTAIIGVARIHMIILSFLSGGLLASLHFFEAEVKRVSRKHSYSNEGHNNSSSGDDPSKNKSD